MRALGSRPTCRRSRPSANTGSRPSTCTPPSSAVAAGRAEPVVREFAPGMKAHLWGYNGQSPGPTIEVVEGDKVRIFVTNKLPEHTTVHWHGMLLPSGMDGVGGLTQPHIKPGKTMVYEWQGT